MKLKHKIKNFILWTLFYLNLASFIVGVCCMDSDYYIIIGAIILLNLTYMFLFYIANYNRFERWIERKGY